MDGHIPASLCIQLADELVHLLNVLKVSSVGAACTAVISQRDFCQVLIQAGNRMGQMTGVK